MKHISLLLLPDDYELLKAALDDYINIKSTNLKKQFTIEDYEIIINCKSLLEVLDHLVTPTRE